MRRFHFSRPTAVAIAAACVALVGLAVRCGVLATLYDDDMELFVYMGKIAGRGGRIGIELIDNKLPTVGLLMWAPQRLIGAWWPGYALLGIAGMVVAAWAIARAAAVVHRSSFWPTLAIAATWMSFPLAVFSAFKLEHVQLPLAALAALAFVRCWRGHGSRDAFFVGLFAGVAALAKPNALAVLAAAWVSIACWRAVPTATRLRLIAMSLLGLAVPAAVTMTYLVRSGAIDALPGVYRQIRLYNAQSVWQPSVLAFKALSLVFLLGLPLLMRGVIERRRREPSPVAADGVLVFAAVWLGLELVGVAMQGRMYGYHFLPLTAPAALLFGLMPRRPMAVAVVGSCAPAMAAAGYWLWFATLATAPPLDRLAAIAYVRDHAAAGDAVWMDEYARLLVETDLRPGSRVPLTFIFSNDDDAPRRFGGMILADLREREPRWVVLPADAAGRAEAVSRLRIEYVERPARGRDFVRAWTAIEGYVRSAYAPAAKLGEFEVYERRPALAAIDR